MTHAIFPYLLKASMVTTIIYMLYILYRGKGNYFSLNRSYLILGVIAALLLPAFNYDLTTYFSNREYSGGYMITTPVSGTLLPEITVGEDVLAGGTVSGWQVALWIYLAGFMVSLIFFLGRLLQLIVFAIRKEKIFHGDIRIVFTHDGLPVFSFFNNIFISKSIYEHKDSATIIAHEKVHIRQMHSLDLMISEVMCIVLWFNPFAYLLKKSIRENHEYLADEVVVDHMQNDSAYRLMLLEYSSGLHTNSLAHNFSYSLIKRRLHMMKKPKRILHLSMSILAITVAFSMILIACSQPDNTSASMMEEQTIQDEVLNVAEVMPEYPGGMTAMMDYLTTAIEYPETAKANKTEGKVMVNFVIDRDGSVTGVKTVQGIGDGCDEEAERVVRQMPDWTPAYNDGRAVKVSMNLPVLFKLGDTDSVYRVVKTMPEYPGGTQAMMKFIASNIKYPEAAKRDSIQGKVFVQFVVEKDGSVSGAKILRGIGGGCDEESLRVVNALPNWKPGMDENGKPVRVEYTLPIKYALN